MDKIKDLLDRMERFTDQFSKIYEGQVIVIKEYVSSLRPLVEDLHSRLKLWEGRGDQLRKDCDRLYSGRNNWMKQALAEDERANATQPVTNCNGFKMRNTVVETEKRIDKVVSILTEIPDSCGYGGLLEDAADELCGLKEEFVKPALAEPPRNCDLYEKEDDAFRAHRNALEDNSEETNIYYEDWLFEKKKGGDK